MSAMNLAQRKLARGEHDIAKFLEAAVDAASRAANLTARLIGFRRMDLDDIHIGEHAGKTAVWLAIAIAVIQQVAQVRVVLLHQLIAAIVP